MTRPTPDQDAVRERLREQPPGARDQAGAEEAPAAPGGAPADDRQPAETDSDAPQGAPSADAEPSNGGEPAAAEAEVVDPLAEAERSRDQYLSLAQRTQADFDNYRKRAAREAAAAGARAKAGLAREIIPAVDNLERALASASEAEQALAGGVRLVHAEMVGALARGGIEAFDPEGEFFDPVHHEALTTRPQEGVEAGMVLDVVEKGYRLGDLVLRPARVVVSA